MPAPLGPRNPGQLPAQTETAPARHKPALRLNQEQLKKSFISRISFLLKRGTLASIFHVPSLPQSPRKAKIESHSNTFDACAIAADDAGLETVRPRSSLCCSQRLESVATFWWDG